MKVPAITPYIYSGLKMVKILQEENTGRKYIYNEVLDITKKFHVPANFHTNKIELPEPTQAVIARLNELGISYSSIK